MSNIKNIAVPARYEAKIAELLNQLLLEDKFQEEKYVEEDDDYLPIEKICGVMCENGNYKFLIKFRGIRNPEWVEDMDCDCEEALRAYLHNTHPELNTIYCICRVSSKQQAGPNHVSLDAQKTRLLKVAEEYKNHRVKTLNFSASAYKGIPKQLLEIGRAAKKGDIILIYRVDRLSRNIVAFLAFLEDLNARGVKIYSQDENLWYHDAKIDFIQKIVDSQREAIAIGKRVKLSIEERKKRGDECMGRAPFGYKTARAEGNRIIKLEVPEEQKILMEIREQYKVLKLKKITIVRNLNTNYLYNRGKKWTTKALTGVISRNMRMFC